MPALAHETIMGRPNDARKQQQTTRWYVNTYLHADDPNVLPLGEDVLDGLQFGGKRNYGYGTTTLKDTQVVDLEALDYSRLEDGEAFEEDPKSKKGGRTLALDAVTTAALRDHRKGLLEERLALGAAYEDHDLVFCWEDGRPVHPHRPTKWLPEIAAELGLPHLSPHGLRHSYSTAALGEGVDIKVLSERLGHANTSITRDLYQHATPAMDREAADSVASAILGD
jgi:integrase